MDTSEPIIQPTISSFEKEIQRQENRKNSISQFDCEELDKIEPSIKNVDYILEYIEQNQDKMVSYIIKKESYLDQLFEVFDDLEDFMAQNDLIKIFKIFKLLIFSCDVLIIERLMQDKYFQKTIGVFEYEPDNTGIKQVSYRDFIENSVCFRKAMQIKDPVILSKIHQTFRLNYLKDSVIAYYIDENLTQTLNTIIYYNNLDVINHVIWNYDLLSEFFDNFLENVQDSIYFIEEFLMLLKQMMQPTLKQVSVEKLNQYQIFSKITHSFKIFIDMIHQSPEDKQLYNKNLILIIKTMECLNLLTINQPTYFCNFLLSNNSEPRLLLQQFVKLYEFNDQGLVIQVTDFLRYIMDPSLDKRILVSDLIFTNVLSPIMEKFKNLSNEINTQIYVQQFVDLVNFCLVNNSIRTRQFIIQNKLLQLVYKTLTIKNKYIDLMILKFFKQIIVIKDELLLKYICNNDLQEPIFQIYFKNAKRSNMINSVFLELIDFIQKENIKKLIKTVCEKYKEIIKSLHQERFFLKLYQKYDQYNDLFMQQQSNQNDTPIINQTTVLEKKPYQFQKQLESEEEDQYFSSDDSSLKSDIQTNNKEEIQQGRQNLMFLKEKMQARKSDESESFIKKPTDSFIKKPKSIFGKDSNFGFSFTTQINETDNLISDSVENVEKKIKFN